LKYKPKENKFLWGVERAYFWGLVKDGKRGIGVSEIFIFVRRKTENLRKLSDRNNLIH